MATIPRVAARKRTRRRMVTSLSGNDDPSGEPTVNRCQVERRTWPLATETAYRLKKGNAIGSSDEQVR
jgi:hypothetical protein